MLFMGRFNSLGYLDRNTDGLSGVQTPLFLNIAFQGNSFHQLHDDKVEIPVVHNVVDIYDIGMGQSGRRLGFHFKLADKTGV